MIYTVVDLKGGTSRSVVDKKVAAGMSGMSIPTFDKRVPEGGYYMMGSIMVTKAELEKSNRGK